MNCASFPRRREGGLRKLQRGETNRNDVEIAKKRKRAVLVERKTSK